MATVTVTSRNLKTLRNDLFAEATKYVQKGMTSGAGNEILKELGIALSPVFSVTELGESGTALRKSFMAAVFTKENSDYEIKGSRDLTAAQAKALIEWAKDKERAIQEVRLWQQAVVPSDFDASFPRNDAPVDPDEAPPAQSNGASESGEAVEQAEAPATVAGSTGNADKLPEFKFMSTDDKFEWLAKRFSDVRSYERGTSIILYITRPQIIRRLNAVIGFANWQDEISNFGTDTEGKSLVKCKLSLRLENEDGKAEWISREDIGTESEWDADKGAATDAFKRAAKKFGIGLYLDK